MPTQLIFAHDFLFTTSFAENCQWASHARTHTHTFIGEASFGPQCQPEHIHIFISVTHWALSYSVYLFSIAALNRSSRFEDSQQHSSSIVDFAMNFIFQKQIERRWIKRINFSDQLWPPLERNVSVAKGIFAHFHEFPEQMFLKDLPFSSLLSELSWINKTRIYFSQINYNNIILYLLITYILQ